MNEPEQARLREENDRLRARLQRSEARLAFVLDVAELGQWDLDLHTHTAFRSSRHDHIFGYDHLLDSWTYERFLDHVLPDDRPIVDRAFHIATTRGRDWDVECRIRRADGQVRWIWARGRVWHGDDGQPRRMVGVVADVTERKEAEATLRASERRLQRAVSEAPFPILLHAEDGEILQLSRAFTEITGYAHEEVPTIEDWTERAYGEHRETARASIDRLYALDRRVEEGQHVVRTKGGEERVWSFNSSPLGRDADGRRLVISMAADVTEHERAEVALAESEARLQLALDAAQLGTFRRDFRTGRMDFDVRCQRLFGVPAGEGLEQALARIPEEDREAVNAALARALDPAERDDDYVIEHRLRQDDGRVRWLSVRAHVYFDGTGPERQPREMVGVALDVTALKQAVRDLEALTETLEERVRRRTQQVQELASELTLAEQAERRRVAQILHDGLQQQLYAVQIPLHILKQKLDGTVHPTWRSLTTRAYDYVADAISTARYLMVDLSPPVLEGEGLREALHWLADQMQERYGLLVTLEGSAGLTVLEDDVRVLLFGIVRELLFNVVQHARTDQVRVSLVEDPSHLSISVADRGAGFEPAGISEKAGSGLHHARERLALFGGRMQIDARPNGGTRITIHIPLERIGRTSHGT